MNQLFSRIPLYVWHFLHKVDEHSLQGPFAFNFVSTIVKGKCDVDFSEIEAFRNKLKQSKEEISYSTYGQASGLSAKRRKKVAHIARSGISSPKRSALFFRIIKAFNLKVVVELGTSLGINTCYLARAAADGKVITFEGHGKLAKIARQTFDHLGCKNIELVNRNIDDSLPQVAAGLAKIDFAFIDANHRSDALLHYFEIFLPKIHEDSIVVVDDIRWNPDMFSGWKKICGHAEISHIFDFGDFGVLFFKENIPTQHFILQH